MYRGATGIETSNNVFNGHIHIEQQQYHKISEQYQFKILHNPVMSNFEIQ